MSSGPLSEPLTVGRYTLYGEIATGGMATIHLARMFGARGFSRVVAVKRMLPQYARDSEFVTMFVDEGRLASRISHPNVVTTFDVVRADGELFIVMEYVSGETLDRLLREARAQGRRVPPAIAAGVVYGVLSGLQAAHEATNEDGRPLEIVHRDVSPQNVIVGADGIPRLADFGIATASVRLHATRQGKLKGKLRYVPPEAFRGAQLTRTADVYSAAVVLWETLTGRALFRGENEAQVLGRILEGRIPAPSELMPDLSRELDQVVMRGLERDPSARYPSAQVMARDLRAAQALAHADEIAEWVADTAPAALDRLRTAIRALESGSAPRLLEIRPLESGDGAVGGVTHVLSKTDELALSGPVVRGSRRRARWVLAGLGVAGALGATTLAVRAVDGSEPVRQAAPRVPFAAGGVRATAQVKVEPSASAGAAASTSTSTSTSANTAARAGSVRAAGKRPCATLKYQDESGIWRVKRDCFR